MYIIIGDDDIISDIPETDIADKLGRSIRNAIYTLKGDVYSMVIVATEDDVTDNSNNIIKASSIKTESPLTVNKAIGFISDFLKTVKNKMKHDSVIYNFSIGATMHNRICINIKMKRLNEIQDKFHK